MIDDIHLASKDNFNNRNGLEILRSWFCENGWVDKKSLEFKKV